MKGSRPRIVVVGSIVTDFVFRVPRRPRRGETLAGDSFEMFLGGKGFNQAVACHRLGADTVFIGRCGQDRFGDAFVEKLRAEGMTDRLVSRDPVIGTGVAAPMVYPDGDNSIVSALRANLALTSAEIESAEPEIERADLLMLQFEVSPAASRRAARLARRHDTLILLDPAPARPECGDVDWPRDFLVPNEVEADALAAGETPQEWARQLLDQARALVISRGERGATVFDRVGMREHPGYRVETTDTTGAGDAFRAGLAVELAAGRDIDEATLFANACGALACTVAGAEPSMPGRAAVEGFMSTHRPAGPAPVEEEADDTD